MATCPERAQMLAARVDRLVALRRSQRADRKVALVVFNFPPNAGNIGSAAYLSVFESLHHTLSAMKVQGYSVDLPSSIDDLRDAVLKGNAAQYGADANVHTLISAEDHVRRERWLKEIESQWGPAPGRGRRRRGWRRGHARKRPLRRPPPPALRLPAASR